MANTKKGPMAMNSSKNIRSKSRPPITTEEEITTPNIYSNKRDSGTQNEFACILDQLRSYSKKKHPHTGICTSQESKEQSALDPLAGTTNPPHGLQNLGEINTNLSELLQPRRGQGRSASNPRNSGNNNNSSYMVYRQGGFSGQKKRSSSHLSRTSSSNADYPTQHKILTESCNLRAVPTHSNEKLILPSPNARTPTPRLKAQTGFANPNPYISVNNRHSLDKSMSRDPKSKNISII